MSGNPIVRREFLKGCAGMGVLSSISALPQISSPVTETEDRAHWVQIMARICGPVLRALSEGKLKATMPVEVPNNTVAERRPFAYLAAMANVLAGIAPWLESDVMVGAEAGMKRQYAGWARDAIRSGTDPDSPDFMVFNRGTQPLVDAGVLALAILRAPHQLWEELDKNTQRNVIRALQSTRVIKPGYNNWLLFSAMVETALSFLGEWWDPMRVDYAIRNVTGWYKGDGVYGDGPLFHWDYYNSFIIQPMLLTILDVISRSSDAWKSYQPDVLVRAQRYAAILERLISPEGTYPPIGRSLTDRFGAFHLLAQMALRRQLPEGVSPEQVRCALTAVMRRMTEAPGTFDKQGWLRIGFCGEQPSMAENYITTGTCYVCAWALLPLGLPHTDQFWAGPAAPWTAQKAWSGQPISPDHALREQIRISE